MKTAFALAALLAASANAQTTCSTADLSALVADPNASACSSTSGVSVAALTGTPTDEQLTSLCNTDSCVAFLEAVLATNPTDCQLPIGSGLLLVSQLLEPIITYCEAAGVEISAGSGAANTTVGSEDGSSGSDATVGDDSGSEAADESASASGSVGSSSNAAVMPAAVGASIVAALSVSAALL